MRKKGLIVPPELHELTPNEWLSWPPVAVPRGVLFAYDLLRTSAPGDFVTAPPCVETDETDLEAMDVASPASGTAAAKALSGPTRAPRSGVRETAPD